MTFNYVILVVNDCSNVQQWSNYCVLCFLFYKRRGTMFKTKEKTRKYWLTPKDCSVRLNESKKAPISFFLRVIQHENGPFFPRRWMTRHIIPHSGLVTKVSQCRVPQNSWKQWQDFQWLNVAEWGNPGQYTDLTARPAVGNICTQNRTDARILWLPVFNLCWQLLLASAHFKA